MAIPLATKACDKKEKKKSPKLPYIGNTGTRIKNQQNTTLK